MSFQSSRLAAVRSVETDIAGRVARGEAGAFESLMRQHNGRLFRVARSILKDDAEAEDALQDAYLDAYRRIAGFRGESALATWLTRIVVNRSLMRLRKHRRDPVVVAFDDALTERGGDGMVRDAQEVVDAAADPPSPAALRAESRRLIERHIDNLPLSYRTVFIMRDVDDMSVAETAACLAIPEATVRTRLFRARGLLRRALSQDLDQATVDVFRFDGSRCDRIVARVLTSLDEGR